MIPMINIEENFNMKLLIIASLICIPTASMSIAIDSSYFELLRIAYFRGCMRKELNDRSLIILCLLNSRIWIYNMKKQGGEDE